MLLVTAHLAGSTRQATGAYTSSVPSIDGPSLGRELLRTGHFIFELPNTPGAPRALFGRDVSC